MGEFGIKRGQGSLFTQEDMSQPFELLTCTGVADLPRPTGDLTPVYAPDPEHSGDWVIDTYVKGEPASPTTTLERPLSQVANFLLDNRGCEFQMLIPYVCEGVRTIPQNFMVAAVVIGAQLTNPSLLQPVAAVPGDDDRVATNAEISYLTYMMLYEQTVSAQSLDNTADANGVAFLPHACAGDCGAGRDLCSEGYLGLDGTQYNAEVKYTDDGGSTWTQTSTDPFLYSGGDAGKPIIVPLSDAHRVIVPRISMAVGEAAEVAYSEDEGVTWSNIYLPSPASAWLSKMFMYWGKIWACGSHGYIYQSLDIGDTWAAQESGTETSETLNDICMYSDRVGYCVGNDNTFLYTLNGGSDWNSRTGPAVGTNLWSVAVNRRGWVFVGAADGNMYRSKDGGVNWETAKQFADIGVVDWIAFDNGYRYIGYAIFNDGTPVGWVYRSFDGGATWHRIPGQTAGWNSGLNDGWICDANNAFVVGEAHGGNTFVAQVMPAG